jgi:hypothetical protein
VGRNLLGFTGTPDRAKFLANQVSARKPEEIVTAYERILAELDSASEDRKKELLADWKSPLENHLVDYAKAREKTTGKPEAHTVVEIYVKLFSAAQKSPDDFRAKALASLGEAERNFDAYVGALIAMDRQADLMKVIAILAPYLEHNLGYDRLGEASFKAGDNRTAERFLTKLKQESDEWHRFGSMISLAEIWHRDGRADDARGLLLECLTRTLEESKRHKGSDLRRCEERYQNYRQAYVRLFPSEAGTSAAKRIPETTRAKGPAESK